MLYDRILFMKQHDGISTIVMQYIIGIEFSMIELKNQAQILGWRSNKGL